MDRLTEKMNDGKYGFKMSGEAYSIHALATMEIASFDIEKNKEAFEMLSIISERLAAYENLGLSPEQLKEVDKLYLKKCEEVNRLKKLLPVCSMGDTVYYVSSSEKKIYEMTVDIVTMIQGKYGTDYFYDSSILCFCNADIGRTIFFEEKEAEAKLKEVKAHEHKTDFIQH